MRRWGAIARFGFGGLVAVGLMVGGAGMTQRPAAAQPVLVEELIGQRAAVCYGDNTFEVVVEQADTLAAAAGQAAPLGSKWLALVVVAANVGAADSIPAATVEVRDSQGRQFMANTDPALLGQVGEGYGVQQPYIVLPSATAERVVMLFPVAADAQGFSVVSSRFQC